ncbi:ANTAR domain-containing protein [Marinomonas sp. 15G1-11]|uniref:ANTAR domain-containing protein n=1 Tax=Marinomonas phaeophyticola TaxID=3004091 RepID=A0ABT4JYQ1_9GAMM|nr:ANTAR domain-containing protein [Marinomonas sp. 15G1-11]MCZ2723403.1 ANTAR domain-containing protein [Marinomonas sp. 15G1-11]
MHSKTSQLPLTVMLVDNEPARAAIVEQALLDNGYKVIRRLENTQNLTRAVQESLPDMVIIDIESPDRDMLENMSQLTRNNPRPIVMFAEENESTSMEAAIRAGVSAYVVDGMQPNRFKPILQVAIARFREFQALRLELETIKTQLEDRKLIDKAKGLIMKHQGCDEAAAYKALRKLAMDRSQRMSEVALNVISVMNLMGEVE